MCPCSEGRSRSACDYSFVIAQIASALPMRVSFVPSQTWVTEAPLVPPRPYPFRHRAPVPPRKQRCWLQRALLLRTSLCSQGGCHHCWLNMCAHLPFANGYDTAGKLLINTVNLVTKFLVWAFLIEYCESVPQSALFYVSLK